MRKPANLLGQTFTRLKPVEYLTKSKWLCECACGKKVIATKYQLETNKFKSCGCLEFLPDPELPLKPISRQNFYQILAYNSDESKAFCLCICEKEFAIKTEDMARTMSCGCIQPAMKKLPKELQEKYGISRSGHPLYPTWACMRWNAKKLGVEIDPDWDSDFLWFLCWCYSQPEYWRFYQYDRTSTRKMILGRRNTRLGYGPDNCRFHLNQDFSNRRNPGDWRY